MQNSKISFQDAASPDSLRDLKDPPDHINILVNLPKDSMVAIVGTRKCTPFCERIMYQLAGELAKAGAVIISGLARGIDTIAHVAAIVALGYLAREASPVPAKSREETLITQLLGDGDSTSESLTPQSGLSTSQFANIISLREITREVRYLGAGPWVVR